MSTEPEEAAPPPPLHPALRWFLTIISSFVVLLYLAFRFALVGSKLYKKVPHQFPTKLRKNYKHGFIQLPSGISLHYVEEGKKSAPLMLCAHGFPEFWYSWRHQLRHFSKMYRVVAFDMRGYGESDKPEGIRSYSSDLLAADIRDIIAALGYKDAVVLAHDWGGAAAWRAASLFPSSISRLVILNCPHPGVMQRFMMQTPRQALRSWYMLFFQMPWLPEFAIASEDYRILREGIHGDLLQLSQDGKITDVDIEAWKYIFSQKGATTAAVNYYRCALQNPIAFSTRKLIQPKTLVVWGDGDAYLMRELGALSAEACRDGRCVYIKDASHWVQQDQPTAVNQAIQAFLQEAD